MRTRPWKGPNDIGAREALMGGARWRFSSPRNAAIVNGTPMALAIEYEIEAARENAPEPEEPGDPRDDWAHFGENNENVE